MLVLWFKILNAVFKNAVLNIALQCTYSCFETARKGENSCGLCRNEGVIGMRRSRYEIMAGVLEACLMPRGKTRIMCKVKLNFTQVNAYLSLLISLSLLSKVDGKYETTDKGRQFVSAYNYLGRIVGIPDLAPPGMDVLRLFSARYR